GGDIRELRPEVRSRGSLDVVGSDAVDDDADLLDGADAPEEELLTGKPARHTARVLEAELHPALREIADPLELGVGDALVAQASDLAQHRCGDLRRFRGGEARVDDEMAGVGVVRVVAVDVIREPALLAQLEEEPA